MALTAAQYRTRFAILLILWTIALLIPVPKASVRAVGGAENAFWFSKVLHVSIYAFLTAYGGWTSFPRRKQWLVLALLSFHTFATEFFQQFVNRGASWRDVGLDHVGIAVGLALGWRQWRVLFHREPEAVP